MEEELSGQYRDARLYSWLTGVFGGSALLLVMIGIYGVISSAVTRRLPELGVRMAVGARPRDIVLLVARQASRPMLIGVGIGAAAALAGASFMASLVYGVTATEPALYAGVGAGMLAAGLLACSFPAFRATRVSTSRLLQCG
jgi:ABC-type antimicrobial peptide transport system permease subunit